MIEERESEALAAYLDPTDAMTTSRISTVEVPRATAIANDLPDVQAEVDRLLTSCLLVAVTAQLLERARGLASRTIRTLDAIHLASALRVEADELIAYDRRLLAAADEHGLAVRAPGS